MNLLTLVGRRLLLFEEDISHSSVEIKRATSNGRFLVMEGPVQLGKL